MSTPTVYVICDQNCKFESMTKEQILAAITQAVNEGTIGNIDTGFITTIKTINGTPLKFFVGEQAAYDALTDKEKENLFAIITNDTAKDGILAAIEGLKKSVEALQEESAKRYTTVAKGNWAVGEVVSNSNFLKPYTKYIVVTNGVLLEGVSNGWGASLTPSTVSENSEGYPSITCGSLIYSEGVGVVWNGLRLVQITASGANKTELPLELMQVIECDNIPALMEV